MNQRLEARPYTAWQLIKVYWQSSQRLFAYFMLIVVLTMSIFLVGMDVIFTTWYNYFYDALQDYNRHAAFDLIMIFMFLAGVNIIVSVYRYYIQQYLALRWRKWLTEQFLDRWLAKRSYYYLENFDKYTDNPDQRIQEDVGGLVSTTLGLGIGLVNAVVTICSFIFVLWKLSGYLHVPLGKYGTFHIQGYLVWVAIIYSFIGTILTFKIGRPLVSLNFEQQRREANFRFSAIDLRSHAEHVALYRGEENQKTILQTLFSRVLENWYAIILRQKLLLWFTAGYNQVSVILPLIVVLPNYFNKVFKLGGLMQALAAFSRIQDAFSFIVNSYTSIAEWQAVACRLITFLNHMDEMEKNVKAQNKFIFTLTAEDKIIAKNLTLNTPNGTKLLENINQHLMHGEDYVIKGRSGLGKSTFVRALAGIWPYGSGLILLPEKKKNIMFLPQTTYMPLGTLREALLFPDKVHKTSDELLMQLLEEFDLSHLVSQLNEVANWSGHLSPGELQRIAFIRVLIHKPFWVFLDESTSALDLIHERQAYHLLKNKLPDCSVVSVGHRPSIQSYHGQEIDLEAYV
ncbi:MAG: bacA [Gammaproteobacteria bacterium]|jgi:putative ATP-binding cassette transporter|nr:bacA [Gammaproteobacteria bacterium]